MTIRSKNPSSLRSQPSVQVVPAGQEKPTGTPVQSPKQTSARDVNEIHLGDSQSLEGMQPHSTGAQSGAEMLRATAQALQAKLQTQKEEAAGILREAMANQTAPETVGRLVALQSEMAVMQKKLTAAKRGQKWLNAELTNISSARVAQRFVDEARELDRLPNGPERQQSHLDNLVEVVQNLQGSNSGVRLSVEEAGAMSRQKLGTWAAELLPSRLLSRSVVSILTQQASTARTSEDVEQWLGNGFGGTNLKRLNALAQVKALKD